MAIGRTNAVTSGMKMITGEVSFSSQRYEYTDYTIDYAVIPASLIGFTPKIVLLGYTTARILGIYYPDEKVIYGTPILPYIVFPDGTAQYFSGTSFEPTGASTDVSYIVLGGTQYAYKNSWDRKTIWFHNDGSLRLTTYRYTSDDTTSNMRYIIHG